jgi:hypothetical protein
MKSLNKGGGSKWGSKYRAKKCEYADFKFDSIMEMNYYKVVLEPEIEYGNITAVVHPKKVMLLPDIGWNLDFLVTNSGGKKIYIDVKGTQTREVKLKMKLWKYFGPAELWVMRAFGNNFRRTEKVPGGPTDIAYIVNGLTLEVE